MDDALKNMVGKFETYQAESSRTSITINTTLLLAGSTILAVTTAIRGTPVLQGFPVSDTVYILTLGLNLLCILLLVASLYGTLTHARNLRNDIWEEIRKRIQDIRHGTPAATVGVVVSRQYPYVFLVCEKAAYISFLLFITGLAITGAMK